METPVAAFEAAALLLQLLGKRVQVGVAAGVEQSEQAHTKIAKVGVGQILAVLIACWGYGFCRRQRARGRQYQRRSQKRFRGPTMNRIHEAPHVHAW